MARVIIVSRTRMAGYRVCVGGVDTDKRISLRLLNSRGTYETANECPYQIWDIWDIDYYLTHERPIPHTEDANVTRRVKVEKVDVSNMSVNRFSSFLDGSRVPFFRGSLFTVFDGKLKLTDNDKLYISKEDVPTYSTCFWINDRRLLGYTNDRRRWQYRYNDMSNRYGYTISYVGSADHPADIEAGSLIRLSLAHWWKPEDSDDEERCYLQLSGCLIQGHAEEEPPIQIPFTKANESSTLVDNHVALSVGEALKGIPCKLMRTNKTYEGTNLPILSLSLSKSLYGQDELLLTKDVFDAIYDLLKNCIIKFDDDTEKYHITLPQSETEINSRPELISHMEAQKAIYPNAYSHWSDEDDQRLEKLFHKGKSIEDLMSIFQRNRGSITSRFRKLGLTQ